MKLTVRNFRGAERADLDCDSIAVVGGRNRQGKSSVCQAIASAVTGQTIPFIKLGSSGTAPLIPKGRAGSLVNTGNKDAMAAAVGEDGMAEIRWPKAEFTTTGAPPKSSPYAAGLLHASRLDEKFRVPYLSELLEAEPKQEDLANFLSDRGVSEKAIGQLWGRIQEEGWDVMHTTAKESGAKLKGQWEGVTGENYGSAKASGWLPEGWETDLEQASRDALEKAVTVAREALEGVVGQAAISSSERDRLTGIASREAPDVTTAEKTLAQMKTDLDEMREARVELPPASADNSVPCPHCNEPVNVVGGKLQKAEPVPAKEIAARARAIEKADGLVTNREMAVTQAETELETARTALRDITDAKEKLSEKAGETDEAVVNAAREVVRAAEERLSKFDQWGKATLLHKQVRGGQHMIDALAQDGVRNTVLVRGLGGFNERLEALSQAAGWGTVSISRDMNIECAGTSYFLLSESEKWMADATMAMATALQDGSDLVILDGADILDDEGREGLIRMVMFARKDKDSGVCVLISMTFNNLNRMPPLARHGLGRCYWMDNGMCSEIGHEDNKTA